MKKKKLLALLLLVQIIIVNVLSFFPQFVETYYSNGLYPYLSHGLRIILGWIGFSLGDVLYTLVILLAIKWLWQRRKTWRREYKDNIITILACFSVVYFLFNILWAVNYRRMPLYKKMGIEKEYTQKELVAFTFKLIAKTNATHVLIQKNDSLKVVTPYSIKEIYSHTLIGYTNLEKDFPYFTYKHESIKSSLLSIPLSYMGFGGYLNPFTNEAQVNSELPKYNLPTTACHEMAHQLGYASESEANFIGFMASVKSSDVYFRYSGYSFALKYCMRSIAKLDEAKAKSMMPLIDKGILENFKESEAFNKKYESFVEDIFEYIYDNYLKINQQKDGMEAYSKFTGLMINYYKDKEL